MPRTVAIPHIIFGGAMVAMIASGAACSTDAQQIRGVLSERDTYEPIELATVTLITTGADTVSRAVTNEQGFFSMSVTESGGYYLIASALGYRSVRSDEVFIEADETRIVELTMTPRPLPLGGLVVETEGGEPEVPGLVGTGFYDRLAEGRGEFILPGEIATSDAKYTQALFYGKRLVRVQQSSHERPGPWNDVLRIPNRMSRGYCDPSIYIDGVHVLQLNPGESIADAVPKDELEAVEIYEWPFGVPMQYRGYESCGVILFWTRRR